VPAPTLRAQDVDLWINDDNRGVGGVAVHVKAP
jgi:hypothetical protein